MILWRIHRNGATVGIDERNDIEGARVDKRRDVGVFPVAGQQMIEKKESTFPSQHFPAVDVPVEIESGLLVGGTGIGVIDLDREDRPPGTTQADDGKLRKVRVPSDNGLEEFLKFLDGVVLVEGYEFSTIPTCSTWSAGEEAAEGYCDQWSAKGHHNLSPVC